MAHDDIPYTSAGQEDVYKFVKDQNKFIATKRTSGISTSDLITKIVYDYDTYVRRNLSRGVSPKDLNLSFLKESEIRVTDSVKQLQGKIKQRIKTEEEDIKQNWESTKEELLQILLSWEAKSHDFITDFVKLFGPEGGLRRIFKLSPRKRSIEALNADASDSATEIPRSPFETFLPVANDLKNKILSAFGKDQNDQKE